MTLYIQKWHDTNNNVYVLLNSAYESLTFIDKHLGENITIIIN